MKLASIRYRGRDLVAAEIAPGELVAIATIPGRPPGTPIQMLDIVRGGEPLRERLAESLDKIRTDESVVRIPVADVHWHPPVPWPSKICVVAPNDAAGADHPVFSLKPSSCLAGHRESIRLRPYYGRVHAEPNLGIVIGRVTRDIKAQHALESVYGYTIVNDIRSDDDGPAETTPEQGEHVAGADRSNGADTFGVMGPWLTTKEEVANPDDLGVRCRLAGEALATGGTREARYKIAEVVSFMSHFQTLLPGDVIAFGPVLADDGCAAVRNVDLRTASGPCEISIDALGTLENPTVVEQKTLDGWRLDR